MGALYEAFLDLTATVGITEPVLHGMLIAAILAISIYLTLYTGMFTLANAGFMAIGAYVSVLLTQQLGWGLFPAILAAMIVAGLIAIPIGLPVLRLSDIYLAIATIGFAEIVRILLLNFDNIIKSIIEGILASDNEALINRVMTFDANSELLEIRQLTNSVRVRFELIEGARGIKNIPVLTESWMLALFIIILILFLIRLHRSRFGRAMAAIRQDETVASNMGINVVYVKNVVFVMSAMIAAAAGGFEGHLNRIIEPGAFGFDRNVDILAYAVLGGTQSIIGPIVGGLVLEALPEVLREVKQYRGLFTGIVLLGAIVYLPNGLVDPAGVKGLFGTLFSRGKSKREGEVDAA